jgi:dTDP-glucose pyrophosphorylase/CBS domain-containing protein
MDCHMSQEQVTTDRLRDTSVTTVASIRDAMLALSRGKAGIALVVDESQQLVGTITDGDIRRALLDGAPLNSPVYPHMQRNFTAVNTNASRAEVLDLMRARSITQVPIINEDGKLIGLHLLREIIGAIRRQNWAVIMAGGRGERLRPLTELVPKPMIRVAGKPILERLVLHLVGYGIREIYLSINYLGEIIQKHFGDGTAFGCAIKYLHEDKPLGTGGALSLLPERPATPLLVMNGDLVTQADIGTMLEQHEQGKHSITVGVQEYSHTVPYGCIELNGERIIQLEEKPVLTRLVNAGIYALAPEVVARVPHDQNFSITALIDQSIALGESVGAFRIFEDWIDVGQKDQLRQAREGI